MADKTYIAAQFSLSVLLINTQFPARMDNHELHLIDFSNFPKLRVEVGNLPISPFRHSFYKPESQRSDRGTPHVNGTQSRNTT
jgi:hypothetical protein